MIHARNIVCRSGSVNTGLVSAVNPLKMTPAEQFGRRLRQLRREKSAHEERDVEQGEVAKAIKDKQPNVARYERGRIPQDQGIVKRLAAFYGVNWIWLLHGEGEKWLSPPTPIIRETEAEKDLTLSPTTTSARAAGQGRRRNR